MRESFIAQYLEEQRKRRVDSVVKAVTHRREVDQWRKNHNPKRSKSQSKPEVKQRKKKRKPSGNKLNEIVESLLGKKRLNRMTSFQGALARLGFRTYQHYLRSPLWKAVKAHVLRSKGDTCFLCPQKASTVHHRRYTGLTLIGEHLQYLDPICNGCHQMIEFDVDGTKLASGDVEEYVQEHLRRNELEYDDVSREFRSMFL